MPRRALVWLHRWIGLSMAGFLIVVGLTGSLLAFWNELNHWLTPNLYPGPHLGVELDAATLARRAEAQAPEAKATRVYLGYIGTAWVTVRARDIERPLTYNQIYLDSVTGVELGRLKFGALPTTLSGVMPFVYYLHDSLAAGEWGGWLLGVVAVFWTIDCFVGFYLTLPQLGGSTRKSCLSRWKSSWLVKWKASAYRINFDLHRAAGLWAWILLLVFAWSAVAMNMDSVYSRVTGFFFDYQVADLTARAQDEAQNRKPLEWEEAQSVAIRLMAEQAEKFNFEIRRPLALYYMQDNGLYKYRVRSSRDVGDKYGSTGIAFDAFSGELVNVSLPTGQHSGNTLTTWLIELHTANVFGLPYQILVCIIGLILTMLSVTGVYIWWKKRASRQKIDARPPQTGRGLSGAGLGADAPRECGI